MKVPLVGLPDGMRQGTGAKYSVITSGFSYNANRVQQMPDSGFCSEQKQARRS